MQNTNKVKGKQWQMLKNPLIWKSQSVEYFELFSFLNTVSAKLNIEHILNNVHDR